MSNKYDFKKIEKKWQERWLKEKVFRAREDSKKHKYYQLETFPYPSAAGLHVGHPKGYIAEDIHARYMRMNGREVLYAMGWDAFGLPTENYAIKVRKSPQEVAETNIKNFKRQLQMFGFSYDWDREINTSSPEYYKWTQWLFIELYKKGLAYRKKAFVNWCPKDQTVLANEQVINGCCERCETQVEQREMEQWFLRITDYADKLLTDLNGLNWPEATIKRQKDWIGKSEGALLKFQVSGVKGQEIEVFTTRPDTLFGATYLVLAPEHPWLGQEILNPKSEILNKSEIQKYISETKHKTELQRQEEAQDKTGVELKGVKAVNPATKEGIPVWIADYVLMGYGTGAIMAVPAHDKRDWEFAKKFNLEIKQVIRTRGTISAYWEEGKQQPRPQEFSEEWNDHYVNEGKLINSGKFDGMDSETAKWEITKFVGGEKKVQYRLRDWSVSRQRYWGCPIPIVYCDKCGVVPVPEKDLPVVLPPLKNYRPKGKPPLASSKEFINVKCPECGGEAKRDTETLDTFVDSSWYYLRYTDPHNDKEPFGKLRASHWLPVDLYVIGAEHTTLHLLYARFITKFLYDIKRLSVIEPFIKLRHQGLILGADGQKMSKSKGNVVNPDEIVNKFGADTVRLYEMFMGPFEQGQPWDPKGVLGAYRFLSKAWSFFNDWHETYQKDVKENPKDAEVYNRDLDDSKENILLHKTIKKVTEDIKEFKFNTAVSAMMIFLNEVRIEDPKFFTGTKSISLPQVKRFIKLLHPFAPHLAQELWSKLGNESYLDFEPWPEYDQELVKEKSFTLVVQVNGRVRDSIEVPADITEDKAKELALESEKVKKFLNGRAPKKIIYVPQKLVNIVV